MATMRMERAAQNSPRAMAKAVVLAASLIALCSPWRARAEANGAGLARPCAPFVRACQAAGLRAQDRGNGKSLVADCVEKLLAGQPAFTATGQTAQVPTGADAEACRAKRAAINAYRIRR